MKVKRLPIKNPDRPNVIEHTGLSLNVLFQNKFIKNEVCQTTIFMMLDNQELYIQNTAL